MSTEVSERPGAVKQRLRERVLEERAGRETAWIDRASRRIAGRLRGLQAYSEAQTVAAYVALAQEVQTEGIIRHCLAAGRRVCVPAYDRPAGGYRLAWITGDTVWIGGRLGIREPAAPRWVDREGVDLNLVPCVAFDRRGGRLGHGAGVYDELLARHPGLNIGLAFAFQEVEAVPWESHDARLDMVVTEKGVHR